MYTIAEEAKLSLWYSVEDDSVVEVLLFNQVT